MPTNISLAAYLVKIRDVEGREDEVLSELQGETDFLDYLDDSLSAMTDKKHNEEYKQVLSVAELRRNETARSLSGIIETGQYGFESHIYSVPRKKVVYTRKSEEADLLPFFFRFDIPEGTDEGLLVLQRTGHYGVRKTLHRFLAESFQIDFDDLRLNLLPVVDPEHIKKYENGLLQEIRLVKAWLPSDLADGYRRGHKEGTVTVELVFKARRGGTLPQKLFGKILSSRARSGVYAIDEGKFQYNDVRLRTKVDGTSRIFSINDPKVRSYYDVTSTVTTGGAGHPTFESMDRAADELVNRLKKLMYLGKNDED